MAQSLRADGGYGRLSRAGKSNGQKQQPKTRERARLAIDRSLGGSAANASSASLSFFGLSCAPLRLFPRFFSSLPLFHLFSLLHRLLRFPCISSPVQPFHSPLPASFPSVPRWSVSHRWAYHRPVPASAEFVASLSLFLSLFILFSPHSLLLFICIKETTLKRLSVIECKSHSFIYPPSICPKHLHIHCYSTCMQKP